MTNDRPERRVRLHVLADLVALLLGGKFGHLTAFYILGEFVDRAHTVNLMTDFRQRRHRVTVVSWYIGCFKG